MLFHLGIVDVTPPNRRRREHAGHAHHFGGVPAWLAARLGDYTSAISGTHEPSTMEGIAIRLAHFGRHLAAVDPDLDTLAGLDRQRHIETYLAATAVATALRGGQPIGAGEQRNRIITLGRFLADIAEWEWPDAPARRAVDPRHPETPAAAAPMTCPQTPTASSARHWKPHRTGCSPARSCLPAPPGSASAKRRDLELDCVHEVPGAGAWLKVPLGKLDSERMVPLDDGTVALIDRIAGTCSPGRPMKHPKTSAARRVPAHPPRQARVGPGAARRAGPGLRWQPGCRRRHQHQLRHTWATALINACCSLQALMAMLGHTSAAMSLRYARLFDSTVRATTSVRSPRPRRSSRFPPAGWQAMSSSH